MVVADKISINVNELSFWGYWMNSSLLKYNEKTFWNLFRMYEDMRMESGTIYLDVDDEPYPVVDEYVEKYKERFISHLVKNYLETEGTNSWGIDIAISQKEKNLRWKKFKIHKKSDTKYIGKSKDGLSFEIRFNVDEDVELDSQIKNFLEADILTNFITNFDDQYSCTNESFMSLSTQDQCIRIAYFLVIGCYLGYLDELDYDHADYLFEFIDGNLEGEDWKRGVSIARDSGSMLGYGMQYEETDYPLHSMFAR